MRAPLLASGLVSLCLAWAGVAAAIAAEGAGTEQLFLSGRGPADAVPWEFTVSAGRRAGEAATIPVPSQWEQHGFGSYHYGQQPNKSAEEGKYRFRFHVPAAWKERRVRLVFDGVMTDARVTLNGRAAGPVHQGGFTRFRYDVTRLLKCGEGAALENVLEVEVAKVSADPETERAERGGDYWVFGGIYRPVWLEALPAQAIEHVAIDARADGAFLAELTLSHVRDADRVEAQVVAPGGRTFGPAWATRLPGGGAGRITISAQLPAPLPWTAETPHLYTVQLALRRGNETLHATSTRFGFRTFEVRDGQGLYLNGQRILLKGVNRHSFRPATGRALNREDCYADVRLIRAMNMNAVRMSHYPPDEAFLEACDELGLYVLDELSGWQHAHGTAIGRLLVRETVERDVNHPSVLFWDNGNEGGWNRALDGEFSLYDPQRRRVLHPWDPFGGIDTKHYPTFEDLSRRLQGPHIVMPTEFLHGLYDGGMGAGLADYWKAIADSPYGAGGFLWVLADEGIVRTDQGGRVDVFSTFAPDGIVGPRHEREGSYHTVRDVWCPVQIDRPTIDDAFAGRLTVHNHYDFTPLSACRFAWRIVRFGATGETTMASGAVTGPDVAPHAAGTLTLPLPSHWREADALAVTVTDAGGAELWTWTWAAPGMARHRITPAVAAGTPVPVVETATGVVRLRAGEVRAEFEATSGLLRRVQHGDRAAFLTAGPRLVFARPVSAAPVQWLPWAGGESGALERTLASPHEANALELSLTVDRDQPWVGVKIELSADGATWRTLFDASRRPGDTFKFDFPPQRIVAVRLSRLRTADGRSVSLKAMRVGSAGGRFPSAGSVGRVTSGVDRDAKGGPVAWLESHGGGGLDWLRWTLRGDGALQLEYRYALEGAFLYHGITFDHPEESMTGLRWLGEGPFRVWQNRQRGTWLGVHETVRRDPQPGETWDFPELEGCFAGVRWAQLGAAAGALRMEGVPEGTWLRVGTPRASHPQTMVDFPPGNVSILHAIPAMGSKFKPAEAAGPSGQPAQAKGTYSGTVRLQWAVP
ncbi:MAG: beta-galactosidase [Verrucomicrobia bacterium]|nr:beta-galactosidase [Verrucomicrobiota bacterium]